MGMAGTLCRVLALVVLFLAAILLLRTATFPSMQPTVTECKPLDTDFIQADAALKTRFQEALRFPTITWSLNETDVDEIAKMITFIERSFPVIHSSPLVKKEVVGDYSLLYTVQGSDQAMTPYLLMAHMDVVPVMGQTWDHPPFEAREVDGYIYARGTIDDKQCLMGIMEALEFRLKLNQTLKRTVYVAFGHDEEGFGTKGALKISRLLEARGVQFDFILDEGGVVVSNAFKGVDIPVGMVGVVEKGFLTLNLTVDVLGTGHSSMPTPETNIGILAQAVKRLETQKQPIMFGSGPEQEMFEHLASETPFPLRIILANFWLFRPIFGWLLTKLGPSTNAFARTTTAVTMFHAGVKTNVLPPSAWAVVNHRLHPAQTVQQVIDHDRRIIGDPRVKITTLSACNASFTSAIGKDSFGYQVVSKSIRQVFAPVAVAPGVMIGATDTRHFWNLTRNIYRFAPTIAMGPEDLKRFHGINERISVTNYEKAVNFYYHVMQNADHRAVESLHSHAGEL